MMLAQTNKYIDEAVETVHQLTHEEKIRMQCEAREDYYRTQRGWQDMLDEKDTLLGKKDILLKEKDSVIQKQKNTIVKQQATYENLLAWAKKHGYKS